TLLNLKFCSVHFITVLFQDLRESSTNGFIILNRNTVSLLHQSSPALVLFLYQYLSLRIPSHRSSILQCSFTALNFIFYSPQLDIYNKMLLKRFECLTTNSIEH
ncbi:hypothetical protein PFISCL1PPCAC_1140, partial [Pristionchus fissidentatus]